MSELIGYLSEVEHLEGELTIPKQLGGSTLGSKTITANGVYDATDDGVDGYDVVTANVPNTYAAGDEGKVVDNGALVSQTTATYTINNTYDTTKIKSVTVNVGGGSPTLETITKTYTPTTSQQTEQITPGVGYDGIAEVDVTVNAMPTGTEGTPTATKGTVSNHAVAVTPSVTNVAGYINGGTKTGTPVTVSASELDSGTKSITANGNNQDVVGYAAVDVAVPNSYSAGDEGKVVSNGALVAQTVHADVTPTTSDQTIDTTTNNSIKVKGDANLVAGNIKKDVVIFNTTGTYEGGGGGSIDFSDIAQNYSYNNIGGLFKAFEDGTWDSLELTVVSGTNPINVDFGRAIKGFIAYPKNTVLLTNLANNEKAAFTLAFFNPPDEDETQTQNYTVTRLKNSSSASTSLFGGRISSWTLVDGLLSLVPQYPGNNSYNPFIFGNPHIFVYWWEGE